MSYIDIPTTELDAYSADQVLEWTLNQFGDRCAIASSFGVEDVALIHMAAAIKPNVRVFCLDTGRLHQQTYDLMDRIRNRYGVSIEVMMPNSTDVETMVHQHGVNLFYDSIELRKRCCDVRKVRPLRRILSNLDAWVTGIRRAQNVSRASIPKLQVDHANGGLVKANPLAEWSAEQVWDYVRENKIPYNPLHDNGFPSIGCEPCTRPVEDGDDARSGRWWWEHAEMRECGLHTGESKVENGIDV